MSKKRVVGRIISALLCVMMLFSVTACGSNADKPWEGDGTGKVVMTYLTMVNEPVDLKKVEAAINVKTKADLDIEVELYPLSVMEQSKYTTLIGGGKRIDLMCLCLSDPRPYADVSMIKRINSANIEKYAPDIKELCDDGYPLEVKNEKGNVIGFSTLERQSGIGGSFVVRKSDLQAIGLAEQYPDQKKITYSDLDTIFAALKTQYPSSYPCGTNLPVADKFFPADTLGTDFQTKSSGVLNLTTDIKSTTIVNYYETDEYKAYIAKMQEWNSKGYVNPDALGSDVTAIKMFEAGTMRGTFLDCWPTLRDEYVARLKEDIVQLQLFDPFYVMQTAGNGNTWGIGGTAQNPTAALRLLNAIMSDQELMNMFQWGIEGEHFDIEDEEAGIIKFHGNLTSGTSGFYNTLGLYGDKRKIYMYLSDGQSVDEIKARNQIEDAISEAAIKRSSPANGFMYDPAKKINEIYAVEAVIKEYGDSIGLGQRTDYNAFISAMKTAGIDGIIADKQAQFNAWLNAQ